ncbi:MAG: protein-L-isoaspartate(D-aspartate) O-methyltransferase [Planctomycetaceae bacterium]|nr:protein-L-isoaspartate(D-aspartate) O-methyltransferase [Planctomycetaceae bacterium]
MPVFASISLAICFASPLATAQSLDQAREQMVVDGIRGAGITNERVIQAMATTPRHLFLATNQRTSAYKDMSLPIGEHQTITPPGLVAFMTEQLDPQPTDIVLEVGTGCGYQAAVLSGLVKEVYSIEIVEKLGRSAARTLAKLKYDNVFTKIGDGYLGWPEKAPFDKIILTCSPENVPQPLIDQLKEGGRIIVPMGEPYQQVLHLLTKEHGELKNVALQPTLFVPMTGEAAEQRAVPADPLHPELTNPSFEDILPDSGNLTGWFYARQMKVDSGDAPDGRSYVTFSNFERGRSSRALQGFAIDGTEVRQLQVSCVVKGTNVGIGIAPDQLAQVGTIFLDANRSPVGSAVLGPWRGTFGWTEMKGILRVPRTAREGIVNIGLIGGTGEVSFDNVQISAVD